MFLLLFYNNNNNISFIICITQTTPKLMVVSLGHLLSTQQDPSSVALSDDSTKSILPLSSSNVLTEEVTSTCVT